MSKTAQRERRVIISVACRITPPKNRGLPDVSEWGHWYDEQLVPGAVSCSEGLRRRDFMFIRICSFCRSRPAMRAISEFLIVCRPQLLLLAKARCRATVEVLFSLAPEAAAQAIEFPSSGRTAWAEASAHLEVMCCRSDES